MGAGVKESRTKFAIHLFAISGDGLKNLHSLFAMARRRVGKQAAARA